MGYFADISVGKIKILIEKEEKEEKEDFYYYNPSREEAGFVCFFEGEGSITFRGKEPCAVSAESFVWFERL